MCCISSIWWLFQVRSDLLNFHGQAHLQHGVNKQKDPVMHSFRSAQGSCSEFGSHPLRVPILEVLRSSAGRLCSTGQGSDSARHIPGLLSSSFGSHQRQEPVQGCCGDCFQSSAWNSFQLPRDCLSLHGCHLPQELHSAARLELLGEGSLQTIEASGLLFIRNKILLVSEVLHERVFWP